MLLVTVISGFYIGLCTYIDTCIVDLSTFVDYPAEGEQANNLRIKQHLFSMINFHISILRYEKLTEFQCKIVHYSSFDILRLLDNVRTLMNGPLFFQLLVYAVFIALNLLQFDEVKKMMHFCIQYCFVYFYI